MQRMKEMHAMQQGYGEAQHNYTQPQLQSSYTSGLLEVG